MKYLSKNLNLYAENLLEEILNHKGIENIPDYIEPTIQNEEDPHLLKNIEEGVKLLKRHLDRGSKIVGIQDCDVDGLTSYAIIHNYIYDNFGLRIGYIIHDGKQHGIENVDAISDQDIDLLIVPDAGSNQLEEITELENRGIDVLCLDHHIMENTNFNFNKSAIINDQDGFYPNKTLSGAGVVYKFLEVCDEYFGLDSAKNYRDLAAIGCIGDVMDLNNLETRYVIKSGLSNLNNYGVRTFVRKQGYYIKDFSDISPYDISFYVVPYMNAVIRVGTMSEKELLLKAFLSGLGDKNVPSTKRGHKVGDTEILAEQAFRISNNIKNTKQRKLRETAVGMLETKIEKERLEDNKILVLALDEYESEKVDPNLTGLVAMDICAKYGKPTILVRKTLFGDYKGSIRADDLIFQNFKDFLTESACFDFVQGHESAAGCGIKNLKAIEKFIDYSNEKLKNTQLDEKYFIVDFKGSPKDAGQLKDLAKVIVNNKSLFGKSVEEPIIVISDVILQNKNIFIMGENKDSIKINLGEGLELIKFKDLDFVDKITQSIGKKLEVVGQFFKNEYMGKVSYQLKIEDYNINRRLEF